MQIGRINKRSTLASEPWCFLLGLLVLTALRFLYFTEEIDEPHSWRQCDTANYIWAFYHDGIDLLHPSVCWMGGHKALLLEFPLHEAICAVFYKVFGPDLFWARLVTLFFFLGAARYLYLIVRDLLGLDTARVSTLIYLAMPLGIFYSRAIHIDPSALFFAHGMLYHFMQGFKYAWTRQIIIGSVMACLAFVIKAPYAFFLAFPLLLYIHHHRSWRFFLRMIPLLALPLLVFYWWTRHTHAVNSSAPDWYFIPDYKKFVDNWLWYFGVWEMRFVRDLQWSIRGHFEFEITSPAGYYLAMLGFFMQPFRMGNHFIRLWTLGAVLYVFIFFNLNVIHNYYQLPLMAPAAVLMAVPIAWLVGRLRTYSQLAATAAMVLPLVWFSWNSYRLLEKQDLSEPETFYYGTYFEVGEVPVQLGALIRDHTPEEALVTVSYGGLDARAPHVLYRARRNGWSIKRKFLTDEVLDGLRAAGCTHLAVISQGPLNEENSAYITPFHTDTLKSELPGWTLYLVDFRQAGPGAQP